MKKHDPLTGEEFIQKKSTQRFAKPENRIKFYNNKFVETRRQLNGFNTPLRRNFCILRKLMDGKKEVSHHKEFLLGQGYCFGVFTNYKMYGGKSYPAVYNYILIDAGNSMLKIINNG